MSINLYAEEFHNAHLGDSEYSPEINDACEKIHKATKSFGINERALILTLASKNASERCLIAYHYKDKYGKELKDLILTKSENSGNFGSLAQLLTLLAPEAEAEIIQNATKGIGTNEELLYPVICGRSNEEIQILKNAYFKRYNQDLANLVSSELSGDNKMLHLACLQGTEEKYDPRYHNLFKAEEDAKTFYKNGEGRQGIDEKGLFKIICMSPPEHLKMVDDAYVAKYGINLEKALKKVLCDTVQEAAIFTLGMKLHPYETVAELIKSTCAGTNTDKLTLSCAILRYQHVLPRVMTEHLKLFGNTVGDRIESGTNDSCKELLLEMVKVALPNSIHGSEEEGESMDHEEDEWSDPDVVVVEPEFYLARARNDPRAESQIMMENYHTAAGMGDLSTIRRAVSAGFSEILHVADSNGWTPLHEAVRTGHDDVVEYLVQEVGLDINQETNGGDSTLSLALDHHGARHPVTTMVQTLLHQTFQL